jgi:hypothetical protein
MGIPFTQDGIFCFRRNTPIAYLPSSRLMLSFKVDLKCPYICYIHHVSGSQVSVILLRDLACGSAVRDGPPDLSAVVGGIATASVDGSQSLTLRPTWNPTQGRETKAGSQQVSKLAAAAHTKLKFRQPGQTNQGDVQRRDLKAELAAAERAAQDKKRKAAGLAPLPAPAEVVLAIEADDDEERTKRRRLLEEAMAADKDDESESEEENEDEEDSD